MVACMVSARPRPTVSGGFEVFQSGCLRKKPQHASEITCRVFTRSPGIHPGSSFASVAIPLRGSWTSHGDDCRATRRLFSSFARRAFVVFRCFQGLLGRVRVPKVTYQGIVRCNMTATSTRLPGLSSLTIFLLGYFSVSALALSSSSLMCLSSSRRVQVLPRKNAAALGVALHCVRPSLCSPIPSPDGKAGQPE